MALYGHIRLLSVLLGTFLSFCLPLYECKELDGYNFPVYSTQFCPRNQTEWDERSSAINCTKDYGYLCFPNEKFTQLLEFCHRARFIWIQEGHCLYLRKDDSAIYSYSCSSFRSGCHNSSFPSYDLFQHPSCTSIGNGCFLAEPSCKSTDTTTQPPETTKSIHVEIVSGNANKTLRKNEFATNDEIVMIPILYGVLISIFFFCMACIICRKGNQLWKRHDDEEKALERSPLLQTDKHDIAVLLKSEGDEGEKETKETEEDHSGSIKIYQRDKTESIAKESPLDQVIFEQWAEDNESFVSTRACKEVEKLIESQNLVVVTGNSGSGKSAIIQHIALNYKRQGWRVKPVTKVTGVMEEFEKKDFIPDKTIFVLNDPIGKESFDELLYKSWKENEKNLEACLKKVKLLLSGRKYILSDQKISGLLTKKTHIVDLHNEHIKLNYDEKKRIFERHSTNNYISNEEVNEIIKHDDYFPLLCKLYFSTKGEKKDRLRLFKEPTTFYEEEIRKFRKSCTDKYCALVLLVLFNNQLCVDDIQESDLSKRIFKRALEICELKPNTGTHTICDALKNLEGSFVKKFGDTYHFYHDFIMEVTTYVLGTDYPADLIQYADIGFLRRRVKLKCCENKSDHLTVYLSDKYIRNLGERFLNDLFAEQLLDVVLNPCLKNEKVIIVFQEILKDHPKKHNALYKNVVLHRKKQETYEVSSDLWISELDFIYLENEITPINALVIFGHTELALFCLNGLQTTPTKKLDGSLLSAVCCNGSLDLFDMFTEDNIKHFLSYRWGFLYPSCTAAAFFNHEVLHMLNQAGAIDNNNYWILLQLATENNRLKSKENNKRISRRDKTVQYLLSNGPDINLCDHNGTSPLHVASYEGYENVVQYLLESGAEINKCKEDGTSPLYVACQKGQDSIVQLLLNYGAVLELNKEDGTSPLYIACQGGHESTVQLLLKNGADIKNCEKDGISLLHIASEEGRESTVQLLLSQGSDVNICTGNGTSPLHLACEGGYESIVQLLIENGADINLCDNEGSSPLYEACKGGHYFIVQILLNYEADINLCNEDGMGPLHISCENGYEVIAELLLKDKEDINSCENEGASPLFIACKEGHFSTVQFLLSKEGDINLCKKDGASPLNIACQNGHDSIVQLLLSNGADINVCDEDGLSPLSRACLNGHDSIVQLLLTNGGDINECEEEEGLSPLCLACLKGHDSIVQLLLTNGADINVCEKDRAIPLYIACQKGHDSTVQLLLTNGADINVCEKDGVSPLYIACQNGHDSTVQLLLTNGADINLCQRDGASPLLIACQCGNESTAQLLQRNGADINLSTKDGFSPLYLAFAFRLRETVKLLIEYGADTSIKNGCGFRSSTFDCNDKDDKTLTFLMEKNNVIDNINDLDSFFSLFVFCQVQEII